MAPKFDPNEVKIVYVRQVAAQPCAVACLGLVVLRVAAMPVATGPGGGEPKVRCASAGLGRRQELLGEAVGVVCGGD